MFKKKVLVTILSILLIFLLVIYNSLGEDNHVMLTRLFSLSNDRLVSGYVDNDLKVVEFDINKKELGNNENKEVNEEIKIDKVTDDVKKVNVKKEESNEEVKEEVVEEKPEVVYDGMTLEELSNKLDRSFNNELSGKGYL